MEDNTDKAQNKYEEVKYPTLSEAIENAEPHKGDLTLQDVKDWIMRELKSEGWSDFELKKLGQKTNRGQDKPKQDDILGVKR